MDRALVHLSKAQKLKYTMIWKPELYSMAHSAGICLPLQYNMQVQELELNGTTVRRILPFLDGPHFDTYMQTIGPEGWKKAEEERLTKEECKLLICMVLERSDTLEAFFSAYLTLWEEDVHAKKFPYYLYEIGMCRMLRLYSLKCDTKMLFFKYMYTHEYVMVNPLLPLLNHSHHYTFNEDTFLPVTGHVPRKILLASDHMTESNLFYLKLLAASLSANTSRWAECWAHSLSALDYYDNQKDVYHHLMCLLALSGGMNSLQETICLKALEEARSNETNIEHTWQRLVTFQQLCNQWGFFKLEKEVFELGMELVGNKTVFYYQMIHHHLKSLLLQIEDILMFCVVRRQYHSQCHQETNFCNKPLLMEYSFVTIDALLKEMEPLVHQLRILGEKEYYLGIMHYYRTFKLPLEVDNVDLLHRQIGNKYISIACAQLKKTEIRLLHSQTVQTATNFPVNIIELVQEKFSKHTMNKWSVEGAEAAFRVVVFFACSGIINGFLGSLDMLDVKKIYRLATHNNGYRNHLINAMVKNQIEEDHVHVLNRHWDDFPDATQCFGRESRDGVLARFWFKREKDFIQEKMLKVVQHFHHDKFSPNLSPPLPPMHSSLPLPPLPTTPEPSTLTALGLAGPVPVKKCKLTPLPIGSTVRKTRNGRLLPTPKITSLDFLQMDSLGEEVYAFGLFIVKQIAEDINESGQQTAAASNN